jgi:hypothetical protein
VNDLRAFVLLIRQLRDLADQARRLSPPLNHDPERFHIERSELGAELEIVANALAELAGTRPADPFRPVPFVTRSRDAR